MKGLFVLPLLWMFCSSLDAAKVCNRNSKREECKGAHPFVSVTVCHNLGCCFDYSIPRNGLWCYSAVEEEKENEEETETENQVNICGQVPLPFRIPCAVDGICSPEKCCFDESMPGAECCFEKPK
ncbi:uncharacterized protein LOC143453340 [Clavelina lepadiformis]|uniref:P-type domain-containing protein n=1 Tax=Clavelina lepadiformis TaxID=159417 RepID=A0ABP0FZN0_CLALP